MLDLHRRPCSFVLGAGKSEVTKTGYALGLDAMLESRLAGFARVWVETENGRIFQVSQVGFRFTDVEET